MNRRSFGKLVGLGALGIVAEPMEAANPGAQEQLSMRPAQAEISQRPGGLAGKDIPPSVGRYACTGLG